MSSQFRGSENPSLTAMRPFPLPLGIEATLFPPTSRYHGLAVLNHRRDDGTNIPYVERRFISQSDSFEEVQQHTVRQGDRIDNLAWQYLGDAEQFWRLCDANGALDPWELTETPGRTIRITLPEGIPGAQRA